LVAELTKARDPDKPKPWMVYKHKDGSRDKLFEPGWAGELMPEEIERLQQALHRDPDLSFWWGYRRKAKRRPVDSIKRVALHGSPESRSHNVSLARGANRRAKADSGVGDSCVTKALIPPPPRLPALSKPKGRYALASLESMMLKLANEGKGLRGIAASLQEEGIAISYRTVGRRLEELRALQLPLIS
jgi:hypothetical protein